MPDNFLDEMELEKRIGEMKDRELLEFTARQTFSVSILCHNHENRIKKLESRSRREDGIIGGAGAVIGGAIIVVVNWFTGRD